MGGDNIHVSFSSTSLASVPTIVPNGDKLADKPADKPIINIAINLPVLTLIVRQLKQVKRY